MQDCSFPDGYKYLLLPKLVHTENSIVDYPFHIYLIEDHQLILPDKNDSLLVLIDMNKTSSLRTNFEFQILSIR
jgi:hypothetical protein